MFTEKVNSILNDRSRLIEVPVKVANASEIQNIDRTAIEDYGIPGALLMECAGLLVVRVMMKKYDLLSQKIIVICGKGNNGGDGFVVGRHLRRMGVHCRIILAGRADKLSPDALLNHKILQSMSIPVTEISDDSQLSTLAGLLQESDLIIDAMFGTGLDTPMRGITAKIIPIINRSGKQVVAIDIPTGVNASTGKIMGDEAIRADITVTMGLPKLGLLLYPGASCTGEIFVADIGFPLNLLESHSIKAQLSTCGELADWIPPRPRNAHKGVSGKIVVIAGSKGYTGAAALTCESALRTGAGLVTLAIPESLNPIMEEKLTETITFSYPDIKSENDVKTALDMLTDMMGGVDVIAMGPGIGRDSLAGQLLQSLAARIDKPAVVDADALFPEILAEHNMPHPIFTPHPGEMARLMGAKTGDVLEMPLEYCQRCSRRYIATVILKGSLSLISTPAGETAINPAGNPGMATAGMGDVLTGIIAGLLAQGITSWRAAVLGAFVHGVSGDLARLRIGERGIIASDLIPIIPEVLEKLIRKRYEEIESLIPIKEVRLY